MLTSFPSTTSDSRVNLPIVFLLTINLVLNSQGTFVRNHRMLTEAHALKDFSCSRIFFIPINCSRQSIPPRTGLVSQFLNVRTASVDGAVDHQALVSPRPWRRSPVRLALWSSMVSDCWTTHGRGGSQVRCAGSCITQTVLSEKMFPDESGSS